MLKEYQNNVIKILKYEGDPGDVDIKFLPVTVEDLKRMLDAGVGNGNGQNLYYVTASLMRNLGLDPDKIGLLDREKSLVRPDSVNPHPVYNTLNRIISEAEEMVRANQIEETLKKIRDEPACNVSRYTRLSKY